MERGRLRGLIYGLGAAALFGASAPVLKLLIPAAGTLTLSAVLYLGAGLAVTLVRTLRAARLARREERAARAADPVLAWADAPVLASIVLLGGAVGPALMLLGLGRTSGVTGALLLNLEAPFTIALAVTVFREHLGKQELVAAGATLAGALVLSVGPAMGSTSAAGGAGGLVGAAGVGGVDLRGLLALAGACLCWAVDNNLSQRLSVKDPLAIVQVKALGAGALSAGLARITGEHLPAVTIVAAAALVGGLGYGVSLVLDMRALRELGAAREAAIFASAPFMGAALSVPLLGERLHLAQVTAAGLMALGVWLLFRARHAHEHTHEPLVHEHLHEHDEHHQHGHAADVDGAVNAGKGPHSHLHRHEPLTHAHPHVSDVHHRHRH